MGLRGFYLALHTFRDSQVYQNWLHHLVSKRGRLEKCSFRNMYTWKKLEAIILSSHVWGIKGSLRMKGLKGLSLSSATYWDVTENAEPALSQRWTAKGQWVTGLSWKKENSKLVLEKQKSEVVRPHKRLPKEAMEFPSLVDAPDSARKGHVLPDQT